MPLMPTDTPTAADRAVSPLPAVDEVQVVAGRDGAQLEVRATKRVTADDPYLEGHFPGFTIYPGVFLVETVAQAVGVALGARTEVTAVRSMRFTAPLLAGDVVVVTASVVAAPEAGGFAVAASCERDDGAAAGRINIDVRARALADA